ncbi:MAG: dTDP-glucose 4,6-dehydratase [Rikenellaceae bacterium]|nr:dTDP-glucose 4,6-dehydratase [Rikenellaceae bacterium]
MNKKAIMVTGGAGFIGCHVVKRLIRKYPAVRVVVYDALTYAGNLANLADIEGQPGYVFVRGDITDAAAVERTMRNHDIDCIINLAAESHVDRSITDPLLFARTKVMGTLTLLYTASRVWEDDTGGKLFYHISTDEVYGSLGFGERPFTESTPYAPRSPYSASKASSDHFVRAFGETYGLPVVISNCSNNYGPYQFPEKLIPLVINNVGNNRPIPVYGTGENVRDWLYVEDHAAAIDLITDRGVPGETYNIGGGCELSNLGLVKMIISLTDRRLGRPKGASDGLVTFVRDRSGHDLRYAIDHSKITAELGWRPSTGLEEGLEKTVDWYIGNTGWLDNVTSGEYMEYYDRMYGGQ